MTKLFSNISWILVGALLTHSCYYDSEEYLYPATACDTANETYNASVVPIVQQWCVGCHSSGNPSGGVIADTWQGLNAIALDGRLWGALNQETGFSPMPKNQARLPACDLAKFSIWIRAGAPEN